MTGTGGATLSHVGERRCGGGRSGVGRRILFALGARGGGALSVIARRRRCLGVVAAVPLALFVCLAAGAVPALAAGVPVVGPQGPSYVSNVTATSVHLRGEINPRGLETHWRFESAPREGGPWSPLPDGAGVVSQAVAEGTPAGGPFPVAEVTITGLKPATVYYVRLFAENAAGEGQNFRGEPVSTETSGFSSFETSGPPAAVTFATHALHGESLRLLASVNPNSAPTSEEQTITLEGAPTGGTFALSFNGQSTGGATTATLTSGSPALTAIPLPAAKGTGTVEGPTTTSSGGIEGFQVTGVVVSAGQFRAGQAISGPGIAPDTHINSVRGTTIELTKETTKFVSGAELTSAGPNPFTVGEAISGAGIPANTTITGVSYPSDFTGELTLSANATASASAVSVTANLPFDAVGETVGRALNDLSSVPEGTTLQNSVTGGPGGPYTVDFGHEEASPLAGSNQPQIEGDASGLTPSGSVVVATTQQGGVAYDTHYHFEYISDGAFTADGGAFGAGTESTPTVDVGSGSVAQVLGADLPALTPGGTYHYRVSATNTSPGNPVVEGEEHALTVPDPTIEAQRACENEPFRTGLSGLLPDCRAYEQISPVDKEGAEDAFKYQAPFIETGTVPGEDGNHFMFMSKSTRWGAGPGAGQAPYFFSRAAGGWQMTAGAPQPETGFNHYLPQIFSPDLTRFAFASAWTTGAGEPGLGVSSSEVEFKAGAPGGPYATVATVPFKDAPHYFGSEEGWVAASEDFSKLILGVEDHTLLGSFTGTKQGMDLYEYSNGELQQANVNSEGHTIGACGAKMVNGLEGARESGVPTSRHAVSADGSRVFFEAVPGSNCSEPTHLYMREAATDQTLDLGAYVFAGANNDGSELLLEKPSGGTREFLLYDVESATAKPVFSTPTVNGNGSSEILLSRDFTAIYLLALAQLTTEAPSTSGGEADIYRYDIPTENLHFLVQATTAPAAELGASIPSESSPDGRYLYFDARGVAALPGGANEPLPEGREGQVPSNQRYRYDSAEDVVECISCASPFDPNPKLHVETSGTSLSTSWPTGSVATRMFSSADGDYSFFETASALLPSDVNGEIQSLSTGKTVYLNRDPGSPSNDVYEWRRDGVGGCAHLQGCLSLITPGTDGYLVALLGVSEQGRDVFFYTSSQLVPGDNDTAGDFYDARIGGGFPEPPRPVACEGDACSTPFAAPSDPTPSSSTFQGAGNVLLPALPHAKPKTRPKAKTRCKPKKGKSKKSCKAPSKKKGTRPKSKKSNHRKTG